MLKTFIKNKIKNVCTESKKAFTLVETLTAMTIIIMAILGPLTVAVYSFSYATETRDSMTASYLASEAIELLKYKRDSIYLDKMFNPASAYASNPWVSFKDMFTTTATNYTLGCYHVDGCAIDVLSIDNPTPHITACPSLYRNDSSHLYSCTGIQQEKTSFSRRVFMENVTNDVVDEDDIRVTSTVTYKKSNGISKTVTIIDFIHRRI